MELKSFFAQDDQGNKLPDAICYLYVRGTETLVEGVQGATGVELNNPFASDQQGLIQFAVANGLYDLRVLKGARDYRIPIQCNDVTDTLQSAEHAADRAENAVKGSIRVFGNYAEAQAQTLSEGQLVEVLADETRNGKVSRFRVEFGELVYTAIPYLTLEERMKDTQGQGNGAGLVACERKKPHTAQRGTVDFFIATNRVSIWEYEKYITNKPDKDNPDTWEWSPAGLIAFGLGKRLIFTDGIFTFSDEMIVAPGTQIEGEGGGRFSGSRTTLTSVYAGRKLLSTPVSNMTGQRDAFSIEGVRIISDAGITFGDPNKVIVDRGNSPYEMKAYMADCSLLPLTAGASYGCLLAKVFNHTIERNDITGFSRGIVELGSDLGSIARNRIINFSEYGVLQLSATTFGSQTQIHHNDILNGTTKSTYIKSTSRHTRINNNYLERTSGSACSGFIDVSSINTPSYGPNIAQYNPYSIVVENNRIDGQEYAADFVYRYEPGAFNAKFVDVGTPGNKNAKPWLTVVGDAVPMYSLTNVGNSTQCRHEFTSSSQRRWSAFRPEALRTSDGTISFNNLSVLYLNASELRRNDAQLHVFQNDHAILMKSTLGNTIFHCILPTATVNGVDINNPWLRSGAVYAVTVVARVVSGIGTLRSMKIVDSVSQGVAIETPLTTQWKTITMTMNGALDSSKVGVAFAHKDSNSTDIEILSVTFKEA